MFQMDYRENGLRTGQLYMHESRWLSRLRARPAVISIYPELSKDRGSVEDFIIGVYDRAYGAKIGVHYPVLMSVSDDDNNILAAVGFRYARDEALFLEQYLEQSVEKVLNTSRTGIVEIGNLASMGGGASLFLFAALSTYLYYKGQDHAVVTGTKFLEKRFRELGLRPQRLASADPSLLLYQNEDWGSYYDTDPHVMAGRIDEGYKRLQRVLGAKYTEDHPSLTARLHYKD